MSNFNLVAFKNGQRAVTRDGRMAEFVGYEPRAGSDCLVAYIPGGLYIFEATGFYVNASSHTSVDLVSMEPTVKYKAVTCYTNGDTYSFSVDSKEKAEEFQKLEEARKEVVTCVIFAYQKE